jgi:hypothetical protein
MTRNHLFRSAFAFAFLAVIADLKFAATAAGAESRVVLYPAPADESLSTDWGVEVNGRRADVYVARVNDPPFEKYDFGGAYSFAYFDLAGSATVRVRSLVERPMGQLVIRPESRNVRPRRIDDRTVEFAIDRTPCQLSIEPDGRRKPLLVFANPLEANPPRPGDPGVVYFGPGRHRPDGGKIALASSQTLYIAGGAVVEGGIEARGDQIAIRGRGILCGNPWPWRKGPTGNMIDMQDCHNVAIEGLILRGSSHWTVVPKNCEHVSISNLKICGGRVQNDDGINPCNSRHVRVADSFIRTDDDCVAAKGLRVEWGDVDDVTIERCALWCDRARVTLLGHESRAPFMRNLLYRDIDVLHFAMPVFLLEPGEDMRLESVRFENIRINGEGQAQLAVVQPTINQYMRTKTPGHIRDVLFKNVTVTGKPGEYRVTVKDYDPEHRAEGVKFEDVTINGKMWQKKDHTN